MSFYKSRLWLDAMSKMPNQIFFDTEYCSHGLIDPAYKIVHMEADSTTYETLKKTVEEMQKIAKEKKWTIVIDSYHKNHE